MNIKSFVCAYVGFYIKSQWGNFGRFLTAPRATKELLAGGELYFYEEETVTPKNVFMDDGFDNAHPNPITADDNGEFPSIFWPADEERRVELRSSDGVCLSIWETRVDENTLSPELLEGE